MRKIKAIGDLHGHFPEEIHQWLSKYDKIIFIGDYVDSFDVPFETQLLNLNRLIELKLNNLNKVELLWGNHDVHYLSWWPERYSGYQRMKGNAFTRVYEEYYKLFNILHEERGIVFSHAGISNGFISELRDTIDYDDTFNVADNVKLAWEYKPLLFTFNTVDNSFIGNYSRQGPLWIRPEALLKSPAVGLQVIGHTPHDTITSYGNIICVDCYPQTFDLII